MSTYAIMVVKNEAGRYLAQSVAWLRQAVDELVVFDDGSIDATVRVARETGALVGVRDFGAPAFLENESKFRQSAWWFLEATLQPTGNDFVVSVDADEFLVDRGDRSPREALEEVIAQAREEGCDSIEIPKAEVFGALDSRPLVRTDGEWGKIREQRIAHWPDSPTFRDQKLAGGSLPKLSGPVLRAGNPTLLHLGYMRPVDRLAKYQRYRALSGHSRKHIESIKERPALEPWANPLPDLITEAIARG